MYVTDESTNIPMGSPQRQCCGRNLGNFDWGSKNQIFPSRGRTGAM